MNKLALGLAGVALVIVGWFGRGAFIHERPLGATQTYPNHVLNATAFDTLFAWGGFETDGAAYFDSSVSISGNGSLTVTGTVSLSTTTINGHVITGGGAPSATPVVGGTSWTAGTLSGNDVAGAVSSTPAASTPGQITVNFGTAFASAPVCTITLANAIVTATSTDFVFVTSSANNFSINFPVAVPPQAYKFNYHCLQ